MYKDNLKSKLALENTAIDSLKQSYDEKLHLSNFASGAVEYGLPCEVIFDRSLEVKILFNLFRMRLKDWKLNSIIEN